MKNILFLIPFAFIFENLNAQMFNKISVELNIGRFSKEIGLFDDIYYRYKRSYLNGFNIGINPSKNLQYYLGFRKVNSVIDTGDGFSLETTNVSGLELKLGVKIEPRNEKKVFLSYGLEFFYEITNHKGIYWTDYPPTYEVNNRKNYFGIAPNLTINAKINSRIIIFADTRYRLGRASLTQKESTQIGNVLYPSRNYWLYIFDPLNSFGIRFMLQ